LLAASPTEALGECLPLFRLSTTEHHEVPVIAAQVNAAADKVAAPVAYEFIVLQAQHLLGLPGDMARPLTLKVGPGDFALHAPLLETGYFISQPAALGLPQWARCRFPLRPGHG
jgi:hypothetical protein